MMTDKILFEKKHRCGVITLNRPEAMNAFTQEMVEDLGAQFEHWNKDNEVYCLIMQSSDERAFCAGADVRALYELGQENPKLAKAFFRAEYALNWQLDRFTKPTICFIDGIVMGGGVGISQYGTHRVAGENYKFAMPETAIGLFPDIGSTSFLSRMPFNVGIYLALTGHSLDVADASWLGLITNYIPVDHRDGLVKALSEGKPVDELLESLSEDPGKSKMRLLSQWTDSIFSASTIEEMMDRLEAIKGDGQDWAEETLKSLSEKSPLSLKVTHNYLRFSKNRNLKRVLKADYDLVSHFMEAPDFYEGVRARLIDKDFAPKWQHETLEDVEKEEVAAYFKRAHENTEEQDGALALV